MTRSRDAPGVQVLFHALFLLALLALQITKRPALFFPSLPADAFAEDPALVALVFSLGIAFLVLLLVWTIIFMCEGGCPASSRPSHLPRAARYSTMTTKRHLRTLPYMPSRFQQLSFRFMLYQQFVVRCRARSRVSPAPQPSCCVLGRIRSSSSSS